MNEPAVWWAAAGPAAAPHVVLVHGSLDRSAGLLRLSRRLDDRFRVLRYDRRGYGRSDPAEPPWPTSYMHDEALDVLQEMRADLEGRADHAEALRSFLDRPQIREFEGLAKTLFDAGASPSDLERLREALF